MIEVFFLSVLQGIAEFLPISSSGHLVLGKAALGLGEAGMRLDIFLHVGTLLAIAAFYRKVIWRILATCDWPYVLKVVASAVPAGIVGILFKDELEAAFASPHMVGGALVFTGIVLSLTKFLPKGERDVSLGRALAMGVAQAVAILPGVSRSGMTLAAARGTGVEAEKSAEFSFLMSAPPIAGAALLEVLKSCKAAEGTAAPQEVSWGLCLFGAILAAIVGYGALKFLLKSLKSRLFWLFGPYCILAGVVTLLVSASACASPAEAGPKASGDALADGFAEPPAAAKPWTYWFWTNTLTDRRTMTEELEDMAKLGFGGLLLTDSRGYWDDEDHVCNPPATIRWGSEEWLDLIAHGIREAARVGIRFSINVAASGGHLRGDVDVGNDSPKFLKCRHYLPGDAFEKPDIPNYRDVAVFAVRTEGAAVRGAWRDAGDGYFSMEGNVGKRMDGADLTVRKALETKELKSAADGASLGAGWTVVRFGVGTVPGREVDIDVLDDAAVRRHLDRVIGRLIGRVPDLVGRDRTLVGLYNVSWEGLVPTWSATFEDDFARIAGYPLRPLLPALAGFELGERPHEAFMTDFRRSRGVMMCDHLYGAVRRWAHEHGMIAFSESGGPWGDHKGMRNPKTFGECDQLRFLAANDFPQGEFWPTCENDPRKDVGHANAGGRYIVKGIVSAAHAYDQPVASVEAFTHMHRHWSVDPAFLKPIGDQALADGINLIVWHTYTTSPRTYGIPGLEYFAGSHINRNVTWHGEFPAMVKYLARCQYLLQRGKPVTDVAVLVGNRPYAGWGTQANGRYRNFVCEEIPLAVPKGFCYDAINDDALARNPALLARYPIVHDARPPEARRGTVDVKGAVPDVETASDWTWCHRRDGKTDIYFVVGEGRAELVFRAASESVEIWDAVTGRRHAADAARLGDGRTKVALELPRGGSAFVLFRPTGAHLPRAPEAGAVTAVPGPWDVAFAYHPGLTAKPPAPIRLETLVDFTTRDDIRHFAGTATYRTTFRVDAAAKPTVLTLGEVRTGLAHVFVNGVDCGTVWCAPWEADIASAVKAGANALEIRYVNNWYNRLVGDCALPEAERVTKSVLRYWNVPRKNPDQPWRQKPTIYSGYSSYDPLQPCGLLGPVGVR